MGNEPCVPNTREGSETTDSISAGTLKLPTKNETTSSRYAFDAEAKRMSAENLRKPHGVGPPLVGLTTIEKINSHVSTGKLQLQLECLGIATKKMKLNYLAKAKLDKYQSVVPRAACFVWKRKTKH